MTSTTREDDEPVPVTNQARGDSMSLENKTLVSGAAATQVSSYYSIAGLLVVTHIHIRISRL